MKRRVIVVVLALALMAAMVPSTVGAWIASHPGSSADQSGDFASFGPQWSDRQDGSGRSLWVADPEAGKPVFVMVHGIRQPRVDLRELSNDLNEMGYGIVVLKLPFADGETTYGGGEREARTVSDAVAWSRQAFNAPIVLMGFSTGGFSALVAIADGLPVEALITDSAFIDADQTFTDIAADQTPLPRWMFAGMNVAFRGFSGGGQLSKVDRNSFGSAPPTLVIHCINDDYVSPANAKLISAAVQGDSWLADGEGHGGAYYADPTEYERRVSEFVQRVVMK